MASKKLYINGIVQGVGFRPFVYQLAGRYDLKGQVANTSSGVRIHVEGRPENIAAFCRDIEAAPPPLAVITEVRTASSAPGGFLDFSIVPSTGRSQTRTLISPDMSICEDCLRELFDPADRRYRYPFINCTNCGPRYTIIEDIPYDRPKTSMAAFVMCPRCQAEYDDPMNRRFHAQPNACPVCGPRVSLLDNAGNPGTATDPVSAAATLLKAGSVLAVKGLGGFHLAADAENTGAVQRLRERKRREEKPFALMARDLEAIRRFAHIRPEEESALVSPRRPIVLLEKKDGHGIAPEVAPDNRYFGVMLPYTPLHCLLFSDETAAFAALVMTSGNISDEPIAIDNGEALERLSSIADAFLVHDRDIYLRSDDAIVRHAAGSLRFIRRSRGYAPTPIFLHRPVTPVLACGASLKNTVCLTQGDHAFLSQHIGDVENLETYRFMDMTARHLERILDITPEIIAHDVHPDYLSTRYALMRDPPQKIAVQHHHAHIASVMAENGLEGPVIGLAFDGAGYGTDGAIWGGEVLITEYRTFDRAAHLAYTPMPGGDAAVKAPWRMALAYLHDAFGEELHRLDLPMLRRLDRARVQTVLTMIQKGFNSPPTSSMGRLFDGIAALLDIRHDVSFEGQAAMALEMAAAPVETGHYELEWSVGDIRRIQPSPIVRGVVQDRLAGVPPSVISRKFHNTIVRLFTELCCEIRRDTGLCRVVMSGGAFQNLILLEGLSRALTGEGFEVSSHTRVPTNDGGLSLGQAVIAAARV